MVFLLESEEFILAIEPKVYKEDISNSCNTIMEVTVDSCGFSANASMHIDVEELAEFSAGLCKLYESLIGEVRIEEPYGMHMYLSFAGDGNGHIMVSGELHKKDDNDNLQTLTFSKNMDQTCLKVFCYSLNASLDSYLY